MPQFVGTTFQEKFHPYRAGVVLEVVQTPDGLRARVEFHGHNLRIREELVEWAYFDQVEFITPGPKTQVNSLYTVMIPCIVVEGVGESFTLKWIMDAANGVRLSLMAEDPHEAARLASEHLQRQLPAIHPNITRQLLRRLTNSDDGTTSWSRLPAPPDDE